MPSSPLTRFLQHLRAAECAANGALCTDGRLLTAFVKSRDETAFAALVERHGAMVWSVCRRILGRHHDAEDAFQATFLVLVRKAASVRPPGMVGNWLHGVAYQTALKARSLAAKRKLHERQLDAMPEPAERFTSIPDWQVLLDQELHCLPAKYRAAIVLCDLEGRTRAEAALQVGVPEGTLAARLARARVMLANRLTRRGLTLTAAALATMIAQEAQGHAPRVLISATIEAAGLLFTGSAATTGAIATQITTLTEGMLTAMLITKLKISAAIVLLCGATIGAGVWVYGAQTGETVGAQDRGQGVGAVKVKEKALPPTPSTTQTAMLARVTRTKLDEPTPNRIWSATNFKEALEQMEEAGFPKILVNERAFSEDNPDAPSIYDAPLKLPKVHGLPKTMLLRVVLSFAPNNNATYLVRPGYIEITTGESSRPERQFIEGNFQNTPLDQALAELADRSGITIVVDTRAADKAKAPVTARFQPETNLVTAVGVLADMCDLKLMNLGQILYVTLKTNTTTFPPGTMPGGKGPREPAA